MDFYRAILLIDGDIPSTEADLLRAWQFLIDSGDVWQLEDWFVLQAGGLIAAGLCTPGKE